MFDLTGQKVLVVGVANDQSIAYGCARAFRAQGADLAITYLNERAEPFVRPLAEQLDAEIIAPLDVRDEGQMDALFGEISEKWGRLDTLLHSIAFSKKDDLHGRVVDCSADGFSLGHGHFGSFLPAPDQPFRAADAQGGTCMTVSFMGAHRRWSRITASWGRSRRRWRLPPGMRRRSWAREASRFMRCRPDR